MHVIVHIGQPKAGSTAIQTAMHARRERLGDAGILVGTRKVGSQDLSLALTHFDWVATSPRLRLKFGTMAAARAFSEGCWDELQTRARARRPAVTLLSSEHFMAPQLAGPLLERLGAIFDRISVICYLRDPVAHYASHVDQKIRSGDRFADLRPPVFSGPLQVFAAVRAYHALVPAGDFVLRNFDRANLAGGDVVTDYFAEVSRLAGREIAPPAGPGVSNESLCGAATAWLLTANETFDRRGGSVDAAGLALRQALISRLRQAEALQALPRLKLTDPALVAPIRRTTRADLDWVNATFLQGQLPFDTALPAGAPEGDPDPEALRTRLRDWLLGYLTPEAMALVAREILAGPTAEATAKPAAAPATDAARARRRAARRAAQAGSA